MAMGKEHIHSSLVRGIASSCIVCVVKAHVALHLMTRRRRMPRALR